MTTEKINYKTTKDACQSIIDMKPVVCPGCGGKLEPLETVDNSGDPTFWAGCLVCESFSWGTTPIVFQIANKIVRDHNYTAYAHDQFPYNGTEQAKEYWYKSQTRGACSDVLLILKTKQEIDGLQ